MEHPFLMFLDHTQRRSTVGRTPLDEWSARLLRSWVRIPLGAWIFVCCECRVLSGRGLCDELITRPEESYRLCCVIVCDLETSRMGARYIYDISRLRVNMQRNTDLSFQQPRFKRIGRKIDVWQQIKKQQINGHKVCRWNEKQIIPTYILWTNQWITWKFFVFLLIEVKLIVYVFDSTYFCQHIFVVDPEVNPLYS